MRGDDELSGSDPDHQQQGGSNSRVRALAARKERDWTPRHDSATDWIRQHTKP